MGLSNILSYFMFVGKCTLSPLLFNQVVRLDPVWFIHVESHPPASVLHIVEPQ